MAMGPKPPFVGAEGQFEGHEEEWKKANVENRAYLQYKAIDVGGNLTFYDIRGIRHPL